MSNPIALPVAPHSPHDYHMMGMGSYTGEDGQFNPQSFTRHFLGSPMSWRPGSFGAQFVPSQSPTAMLVGSYDPAKSLGDSSILNAWNVFDRQGELCRNYTCCGTHLPDLHALLEHFEDVHIVVKDRNQPPQVQIPFNPQELAPTPAPAPHAQLPQPQYSTPFDTDDMDLGLDYDDASPPPPSTAPTSTVTSRAPSPMPSPSAAQRPALNIALSGVGVGFPFREGMHTPLSASSRGATPFTAYSAEYSPPHDGASQDIAVGSVAPALVFGSDDVQSPPEAAPASTATAAGPVAAPTASTSRQAKSKRNSPPATSVPSSRASTPSSAGPSAGPSAVAGGVGATAAAATILLPHKPFRCPKPHCSKSYKQANGLKYHLTHGSCSYAPAKDVEAVRALLERKRATANNTPTPGESEDDLASPSTAASTQQASAAPALSQAELNEVEVRVRPYACGVGDCSRRYKNMNGLRYHYQHSGDHGAVGLGLLAGGLHGCLKANANAAAANSSATAPPAAAAKAKGTGSYAWGSTLLPHIQAVATTAANGASAANASTGGATTTFAITPQTVVPRHQQVQAGWYAGVGSAPGTPTQPVDVSMG